MQLVTIEHDCACYLIINNIPVSITPFIQEGNRVALGVSAPANISVDREEIYFAKKKNALNTNVIAE